MVHSLLALGLLGSGCSAGGGDAVDEAAPAGRGTSTVTNSSSSPAVPPAGGLTSDTANGAASSPATSVNEAQVVSALTTPGETSLDDSDEDASGEDDADEDDLDEDDSDEDDSDEDDSDEDDLDEDDLDEDDLDEDDLDEDDADEDDDDVGVTPPAPGAGTPDPNATPVTFTSDIRALLVDNCGRCHASGGLPNFASANAATAFEVAVRERNEIVAEITSGNMPADTCNGAPGTAGCVSTADLALIRAWIAAGTPE